MNSVTRVGTRLRELRKRHGLTQQELAELADFNQNFVQQIEAGRKKEIWVSTVERLAAAFCLELHEFLAPELPAKTKLAKKVVSSRVHRR
ncbi:MAG: helix-turn-helix transcriptional regulator [Verrucomicrobiota bacterium JB024]|nr:helix-turn-helix transcriptional regulator [Verrucomicrobiota bacterium JB024]